MDNRRYDNEENDKVAVRFTMKGTHQGTFFGVPATEKTIVVQAMNFYRLADDQIIEEFGQPDMLGLLRKLGQCLKFKGN